MKNVLKRTGLLSDRFAQAKNSKPGDVTDPTAPPSRQDARKLLDLLTKDGLKTAKTDESLRRLAAELVARVESRAPQNAPVKGAKARPRLNLSASMNGETRQESSPSTQARGLQATSASKPKTNADHDTLSTVRRAASQRSKALFDEIGQEMDTFGSATRTEFANVLASPPGILSKSEIAALARNALHQGQIEKEHPVIIAAALCDKSRREQAAVLSALPSGLTRTVQRLLIQNEILPNEAISRAT